VPRDINDPPTEAYEEPVLTPEMVRRINQVIKWGREHPKMTFVGRLITATKLSEFVYDVDSYRRPSRPVGDPIRARLDPEGRLDPSGPAANTRASTPRKGKGEAPSIAQPKPKVDKGKAKVVDTGKPTKVVYPIMTGGDFKIREPKVPTPPSLPINPPAKKGLLVDKPEKSPRVVRALRLLDEEESPEAGGPAKDLLGSARKTYSTAEESVEAVEAPLVKRRKLTKAAGEDVPVAGSAPLVDEVAEVAGFLASRRRKAVPHSVPPLVEVEKFVANEPVLVVPVAVAKVADEEPLRVPEGSIPALSQPFGSNIRHILEDIEMMSDDSVGVAGDNMGASPKAAEGVPGRALSPIPEAGNASRAPTPGKLQSPTPEGEGKGAESRRSNASEASGASGSESPTEIKP
jgi:hypothetical protein